MIYVDGFLFEDEEMAKVARREEEGIRFIKQRTALDNPEVVLNLYKKLLEQELFVTPVGIRFLTELQNVLLSSVYISREEIPAIPVKSPIVELEQEDLPMEDEAQKAKVKTKTKDYRNQFVMARFCAIVLGLSIVGMFVINAISGNNVNIINYREELLNQYSSWEAELEAEEERLERWEESLEKREEQLREQMNNGQ